MDLWRFGDVEERRHRRYALILSVALIATACRDVVLTQTKGREAALRDDLIEMRKAIDNFRQDKQRGPHSLSELKTSHYLRDIPADPVTGSRNWRLITEVTVASDDFTRTGAAPPEAEVVDIRSRAVGKDSAGKRYSDY